MAITAITVARFRMVRGADWRSLLESEYLKDELADGKLVVIDMTIEQRNKLDGLEPWQYINIPTPDFQCPSWTPEQWLGLAAFVYNESDVESTGSSSVVVACQGGQGRTGVALAILRAIIAEDFACPVRAIRKFNPLFIETPAQEAYVERIVRQIDEMTRPVPVIEPINWPARCGIAEKRLAESEAEVKRLMRDNAVLMDECDELKDKVYSAQEDAMDKIAKRLHDALGIVFENDRR